jgi:aspartate kinase
VRGRDRITSLGEQLSANILAAVLRERGMRAQAISAAELIITDSQFGAARPIMKQTCQRVQERLKPIVKGGAIPVVTGYIAATGEGVMTTLGRGGSDFSASILGACLKAEEVWIWSDVDGILTADPNFVSQARTINELSYEEAAELAHYGAEVLHPKTIQPLYEQDIPLRLLNSFNPKHPGTHIVSQPDPGRLRLPAIISTTGLSLIRLSRNGNGKQWSLDHAGRILLSLGEAGLEVPMFSQSFSENSLNLIIRQADQAHCLSILEHRLGEESVLSVEERVATISVVGVPDWNGSSMVSQTFTALGVHGVRVIAIAQAASEYSVSICILEGDTGESVRSLHRELGLEQ